MASLQTLSCIVLAFLSCCSVAHEELSTQTARIIKASQPNIIVFVVDDMGFANIGFHNPGPHVKTPNLDAEAANGTILMRHYTYCWCAPTRSALMTGRLPYHVLERTNHVDQRMTMMPAKLSKVGYSTHQIGKWHLGLLAPWMTPAGRGFHTSLGYLSGAEDHYTQREGKEYGCEGKEPCVDLWSTDRPAYGKNGTYGSYIYSTEVQRIIEQHEKEKPLFMYVALQVMHAPQEVPPEYSAKFPSPKYSQDYAIEQGMGNMADEVFGNMTKALRLRGMWENTLVVMLSDNGGPAGIEASGHSANNYPLRGGKTNYFEGGIRVASFVGGGFLPSNMRGNRAYGYMSVADWYSTLLPLAGADPTDSAAGVPGVDGLNMWPYLSGQQNKSPRTEIMIGSVAVKVDLQNKLAGALISGKYKIVLGTQSYGFWQGPIYPNATTNHERDDINVDCKTGCLFDIIDDPGEHKDLAKSMPEKLQELLSRWKELKNTSFQAEAHPEDAKQCKAYYEAHGGFCGPYSTSIENEVLV